MDLHLKQWRSLDESDQNKQWLEQQHPRKYPKLLLDDHHHHHQHNEQELRLLPPNSNFSLSLCGSDQHSNNANSNNMSQQLLDSTNSGMGSSNFSTGQWQELELQALIYRYMLAGVAVPPELLQHLRKSLHHLPSSPYFLTHPLQHYSVYQPALLQSGYWGKAEMDPEPGRCRRTDGKKWRCSREVVAGQKYCERHVHRGRNRSRKPVESTTSTSSTAPILTADIPLGVNGVPSGTTSAAASASTMATPLSLAGEGFSLSGLPPIDLLQLNHSHVGQARGRTDGPNTMDKLTQSNGHVLRPFLDDWPRSAHEPGRNSSPAYSPSISLLSSDVALKLATGPAQQEYNQQIQSQMGWAAGWAPSAQLPSMGGPLAEALRQSASNSSPTSVLNQHSRGSASEATSYASS